MSRALQVDFASFQGEVLNAAQPVIVNFWAASCAPCHTLTPILEEIGGELGAYLKIVRVNVDENPALAEQYHVESLPTLIYFANGFVHDQTVGLPRKEEIISKIRSLPR